MWLRDRSLEFVYDNARVDEEARVDCIHGDSDARLPAMFDTHGDHVDAIGRVRGRRWWFEPVRGRYREHDLVPGYFPSRPVHAGQVCLAAHFEGAAGS